MAIPPPLPPSGESRPHLRGRGNKDNNQRPRGYHSSRRGSAFWNSTLGRLVRMLLDMFGGGGRRSRQASEEEIANAIELLESLGYEVRPPRGVEPPPLPGRTRQRVEPPRKNEKDKDEKESRLSEEIFTPGSSNVYSFQYDGEKRVLYVTFKAPLLNPSVRTITGRGGARQLAGVRGRTIAGKSDSRGPTYAYYNVPERIFTAFQNADSDGKFVWDKLRVRGSHHAHQFPYKLVAGAEIDQPGVKGTYIPRAVTGMPGGGGYRPRGMRNKGGKWKSYSTSTIDAQENADRPRTSSRRRPGRGKR